MINEHAIAKAWREVLNAYTMYGGHLGGPSIGHGWQRFSVFHAWSISQWRQPTMSRRWSQGSPCFQEESQLVLAPGARMYCSDTCKWVMG